MKLRSTLVGVCMGLAMLVSGCLPVMADTRRVVLLLDERIEMPGLSALVAKVEQTLRSNSTEPIEVYRETMDLSRFGSTSYNTLLRDFLRAKYADKKIDVVVSLMPPAFDFLLAYGDLIFPETPIVFTGLDSRKLVARTLPPNVYGVLVEREFAPTVELALRLHPATENFVVVSGTSEVDTRLLALAQREFRSYEGRVSFTYLFDTPMDQLLATLPQLRSRDIVIFTSLLQDGNGQPYVPSDVIQRVSKASSVPVYGSLDQFLGLGILGGSLYSISAVGTEAAKMVLALLTGATPLQKVVEVSGNKVAFDWRQMRRWNISEARLPSGSEIDFREPTVWQQYPWQIPLIFALFLAQTALILVLLNEHRRRQLAEVRSREHMAELAHINRFATAGEMTASIAHEISQPLGSILLHAQTANILLQSSSLDITELKQVVNDILQDDLRATEVIRRMRSLLAKAPFELKNIDLNVAVKETVAFLSSVAIGRKAELVSTSSGDELPILGDGIQLQQVIINLVVNAIDAMKDTPRENRIVSIRTLCAGNFAELSVSDRGHGIPNDKMEEVFKPFYTSKADDMGMGMGLSIARTIIEAHNGVISARNRDHGGASFRIRLPLVS